MCPFADTGQWPVRLPEYRDIGLTVLVERCRHANDDRLDFVDTCKIRRGLKSIRVYLFGHGLRRDVSNVTSAFVESVYLFWIDVEPQNIYTRTCKLKG